MEKDTPSSFYDDHRRITAYEPVWTADHDLNHGVMVHISDYDKRFVHAAHPLMDLKDPRLQQALRDSIYHAEQVQGHTAGSSEDYPAEIWLYWSRAGNIAATYFAKLSEEERRIRAVEDELEPAAHNPASQRLRGMLSGELEGFSSPASQTFYREFISRGGDIIQIPLNYDSIMPPPTQAEGALPLLLLRDMVYAPADVIDRVHNVLTSIVKLTVEDIDTNWEAQAVLFEWRALSNSPANTQMEDPYAKHIGVQQGLCHGDGSVSADIRACIRACLAYNSYQNLWNNHSGHGLGLEEQARRVFEGVDANQSEVTITNPLHPREVARLQGPEQEGRTL